MFPSTRLRTKHHGPRARFGRFLFAATLVFVCAVSAQPPVSGQEPEPAADDDVLRTNTDLLIFAVRIRDRQKQSITTLTQQDLTIKDPDQITSGLYFSHGIDRVALVFALDQSGSTRETIALQRHAALGLFSRFGDRSKVAVIRFGQKPVLASGFGRAVETARAAFNFHSSPNQRTAIFDAAMSAMKLFDELPKVRSERRIVVLISDGLDNASSVKADAVVSAAQKNRVSFYVIHIPLFEPRDGRLAVRSPAKGFRDLAEKTNGKYFLAGDAALALAPNKEIDLAPSFKAIEDDLRSQYLIGFYLGDAANDGRKHRFSLTLPKNFEFQVGHLGYSRTHEFFVHRPRKALANQEK